MVSYMPLFTYTMFTTFTSSLKQAASSRSNLRGTHLPDIL